MNKDRDKKIGIFHMAFLYIGTIIGAGFASGREIWQFFGIFGRNGIFGLFMTGIIFIVIGYMSVHLSLKLNTDNIVNIVSPFQNKYIKAVIEYSMATILVLAIVNMSSAAGALLNQEFGLHKAIGGFILVFIVIATVIGGFERVSHIFQMIMPILIILMIITSILLVLKGNLTLESLKTFDSPVSNSWVVAGCMYFSYNIVSAIPILSSGAKRALNKKTAILGGMLGGFILFLIALMLLLAMDTNQDLSDFSALPMLALSKELGKTFNVLYAVVLVFAIYSSATGNFYGFRQKLKDDGNRNKKLIIFGILGFLMGLAGFKNVVAYMLPLVGAFGFCNFIFIIMNFIRVFIIERNKKV